MTLWPQARACERFFTQPGCDDAQDGTISHYCLREINRQNVLRYDSRVVTLKLGDPAGIISFNLIVQFSDGAGETVLFLNLNNYQLNSLGKSGTSLTKTYKVKEKNSPQIHLTAK